MIQPPIKRQYLTTSELGNILGISRIAVFKKIQKGYIKATKSGRSYVIHPKDVPEILGRSIRRKDKTIIRHAVAKTIKEYGSTLRMLGNE